MARPVPDGYVGVAEAARRLGLSISGTRRRIRSGAIPSVRAGPWPGARILIQIDDLPSRGEDDA